MNNIPPWKTGLKIMLIAVVTCLCLNPSGFKGWVLDLQRPELRTPLFSIAHFFESFSDSINSNSASKETHQAFILFQRESKFKYKQAQDCNSTLLTRSLASVQSAKKEGARMLLLGDSLMKTILELQLKSQLKQEYKDATVDSFTNIGTGVARPDVFNWEEKTQEFAHNEKYDATFIFIGMNDAQSIYVGEKSYRFGTPRWKSFYLKRVQTILNTMCSYSKQVYWIGLPPVRDLQRQSDLEQLTETTSAFIKQYDLDRSRFISKCVKFIPSGSVLAPTHKFSTYLKVDTRMVKVREKDGIHLTLDGAEILAKYLIETLKSDLKLQEP